MKRILGILFLVLALLSTVNLVKQLAQPGRPARPGSSSYESGRKAGMYFAPLLLGGLGLWLLLSSGDRRPAPPRIPPGESPRRGTDFAPAKPWFKTLPAIIGFSAVGGAMGLVILMVALGAVLRASKRNPRISVPPQTGRPITPGSSAVTRVGPYSVGGRVNANWTGRWIPGTITAINPGGFTMMIQLEDARFPRPIVLSTNQLRLP